MPKDVFDTSVLIRRWERRGGHTSSGTTERHVKQWARELIQAYRADLILTPVYVEFVAGVTSARELALARAFLAEFTVADDQKITPADWRNAVRIAQRVPRDGQRRQLGDCLIAAIADRLGLNVITLDLRFPH
jgi:predicted nucleic acid-binding protein